MTSNNSQLEKAIAKVTSELREGLKHGFSTTDCAAKLYRAASGKWCWRPARNISSPFWKKSWTSDLDLTGDSLRLEHRVKIFNGARYRCYSETAYQSHREPALGQIS